MGGAEDVHETGEGPQREEQESRDRVNLKPIRAAAISATSGRNSKIERNHARDAQAVVVLAARLQPTAGDGVPNAEDDDDAERHT